MEPGGASLEGTLTDPSRGAPPAAADAEAARAALADRYRLGSALGAGGMATVYRAEDLRHGREVAIKILHRDAAAAIGAERFHREIRIAAGLNHPNVLGLLDSGEAGGVLYAVMPLVQGQTLRQRLAREGELPIGEVVAILRELADALAYAHARGVVHRDVKPENVLLGGGHAWLADFGVAKAAFAAGGGPALTAAGGVLGTPAYMAPEQAAGDAQTDHRADLYALGIVAYEMLAGATPFAGLTTQQLLAAHLSRPVTPIAALRPSIPAALAAAVMRCLEKRPADRWQSAAELLRRLSTDEAAAHAARPGRRPARGSLPITEALCRRLDRASFDPRMIGDALRHLDNEAPSDVLVLMLNPWGLDEGASAALLETLPYRAVVPTLFGFDAGRTLRFPLTLADHLVLLEELVCTLAARIRPKRVVLAGFSAAGDLLLRLAAGAQPSTPVDGCLVFGMNLGIETCFVSKVLAGISGVTPAELLPPLNSALGAVATVGDWANLADYLVQVVRNFRSDWGPIRSLARGVVEPWLGGDLAPFVTWYRAVTGAGRRLRCVFEDSELYRGRVRELQLRNLDTGLLGPGYRPGSIVVEPVAGHFDLIEPERFARHLRGFVAELPG